MSLLDLEGVTKRFHAKNALSGIDLSVGEGESLVLFGPNGAGKTTLIKIMAGIMSPTEGRVFFEGSAAESSLKQEVFYLGHKNSLYNSLTVYENLHFLRRLFRSRMNGSSVGIDELLKEHGLWERRDDPVHELSQGMKRRVAIAKGFLTEPKLLIMDEPFTGLDFRWRRAVLAKIRGARDRGKSLVLSTHLVAEGYELADRIAFLDRGSLMFVREKKDVSLGEIQDLFTTLTGGAA
jgi:heme ABC exporter ATP-binding subunit CcmA